MKKLASKLGVNYLWGLANFTLGVVLGVPYGVWFAMGVLQ